MKVLLIHFIILNLSFAEYLISSERVEALFKKLINNEDLSQAEHDLHKDLFEILRRQSYVSSREERQSDVRMSLDCLICRSAFSALINSINEGRTDEELIESLTTVCTSLAIANYNVCHGAIKLNLPILNYIIKNTPEATARSFCGNIFQNAHDSNACVNNDPRLEWEIELPEQNPTIESLNTNADPLTIGIITDAHIDPLYEAYGVAECDEPTCCRKGQKPSNAYSYKEAIDETTIRRGIINVDGDIMLDLSVAPEIRRMRQMSRTRFPKTRNVEPAGYWGDYRNCDTPRWAFDDVIERMAASHTNIDLIYYIGDTIDHFIWETSYDMINETNLYLIKKMKETFGDHVMIIPAIGNHESQPTNQFAPLTVTEPKLNTTWLYEALVAKWEMYLTEEAKVSIRARGSFSRLVRPGLRAISINNNVAYRYNWWIVYDPLELKRHLEWLVTELYAAEIAGEKVHIIAHIPPGVHDFVYVWTREYNKIVNRFSSTIIAEFNGHVHSDEFKIFYNITDGRPINVAWGAGAATAYTFYNLNYKIATIDSSTYEPLNIVNYIYNLTEANLTPHRKPHWFQLYDMKNNFGLSDLSADSMNNLVYRMVTDNTHLLDLYSAYYYKLSDARWPHCNDDCKLDNLCRIVTTVLWEREKCEELRNEFYLNR